MDFESYRLAKTQAKSYTDTVVAELGAGFSYKGSVDTISELPETATLGDMYTVAADNNRSHVWDGTAWVAKDNFVPLTGGSITGTLSVSGGVTANLTGNVSGNVTGNVAGDLTGDVTGDLEGDVTGNLTGNVTGDVTGNVTGDLTGTASKATADADGNVITTTYSTIANTSSECTTTEINNLFS